MVTRRFAAFCAAALLAFGSARSAEAITILPANVGDSFSYTVSGPADPDTPGFLLSADFEWTLVSFGPGAGGTAVIFDVEVTNTSTFDNAALTAFSFTTVPLAIGADVDGSSIFSDVILDSGNQNNPQTFTLACVQNDTNSNCNGNDPNNGLDPGDSDSLQLGLIFAGNIASITLDDFCGRFQGVGNGNNTEDSGKVCSPGGENFTPVPEPGSMALLGAGIAALAARRARKKRAEV